MYRRKGGVQYSAEQNSPTESPPDWDLNNLIGFTPSFATTCHKESLTLMPTKMPLNSIAPTTSVIGSWMEEEIKPLKSILESLQGLNPAELRNIESLLAERDLNTPPPLPVLSDIDDCIALSDTFDSVPVVVDTIQQKGLSPHRSGESPLLDPTVENTVNLRDLFSLHDIRGGLLDNLSPDPLYLGDDQKQFLTDNYKQLSFEDTAEAAVNPADSLADTSFVYLPAVCLEEQIEETVVDESRLEERVEETLVDESKKLLDLNNFDSSGLPLGSDTITISIEDFNLLRRGEAGLTKSASDSAFKQSVASTRLIAAQKSSQLTIVPKQGRDVERSQLKIDKKSSNASSRKRRIASLDKESDEYKDKRARNNESVRKSRDKAKQKQEDTENRLYILSTENQRLSDRVQSLEKELSVLRGLFTSTSLTPPSM